MEHYDPQKIEQKWQRRWDQHETNSFSLEKLLSAENPFYNLMMFPYPSAEGLHIGNIYAYTGADVQGRYQRLTGKTVFEPIGFDAFGIHSENYALKMGTNPNDLIPRNIANFTTQLRRIGGMFDWNHTVDTTDPSYYKWTQWIFIKLFKAGLVERRDGAVNWCPQCNTVIANEQVIDGACERCDAQVEQRQLPQWYLRISKYTQRLLANIPDLDWSGTTKIAQTNWIGASPGANVKFAVSNSNQYIEVFTTRPDTLFGATYMVLAPEHELVESITTRQQSGDVAEYLTKVSKKDLIERQKVDREKTGVFTGSYCINPVNQAEIPIWISDYVLAGYGTGAIMAVPGHDQRDFEFANKFSLPIVRVISETKPGIDAPLDEAYEKDGFLINSGGFNGLSSEEAKREIVSELESKDLGNPTITYRLHDWCISRQRYWGPPIPIIYCATCGPCTVPEEDLPIELPYLEDFRPDDQGQSPLARDREWAIAACPKCGSPSRRETDVSDTFLDSSWYFLRYPCTDNNQEPFSAELTEKWLPVHSYIGGNEHAVLHLLYSRFITMALSDLGYLHFEEPYKKFRAHGLLIKDGKKISKSRGNIIVPDDLIVDYGADTVRMYLMFLGPFEQGGDYQELGIQGPRTFLNRLWQSVMESEDADIDTSVENALHRTIKHVTTSIKELRYNTAIAAMMEYLNAVRAGGRRPRRKEIEPLIIMIAPFCPHIAEELHEKMGGNTSVFESLSWPEFDPQLVEETEVEIAIQINGKMRATIQTNKDTSQEDLEGLAFAHPNVDRYLKDCTIKRVIHVPGRMLSIVIEPDPKASNS